MRKLAVFLAVLIAGSSFASASASSPSSGKLRVIASASPLFDVLSAVGGERTHATNLNSLDPFGPLTEPQQRQLREASLAVILGKGAQPEIERIAAQRTGPTIRVLDVITGSTAADPYVWLDPNNMMAVTSLIREQLDELDPKAPNTHAVNESRVQRMLSDADRINERTIATCERRDLVTLEPDFNYLTDRFGLNPVVATKENLPDVVRQTGATTVFFPTLPSLDEAKRLKASLGIRVAVLDPMIVRTDQARRGGADYGSVMALNLDVIREGLDCKKVKFGDK